MGLLQQLYINSSSFATATAVFTDQALTTLAPDGFYSLDGIVREQVSGVLQQTGVCEACSPNCGEEIVYIINTQGEYTYEAYLGDSIGAVRVHVNTLGGAAGFRAVHNGTTTNAINTRNLGVKESSSGSGVTYIGESSTFSSSGVTVPTFEYGNGEWAQGANTSLNPFAGSNLTAATYHGGGVITFTKMSSIVNTCEITIRVPFASTSATIQVDCVALLPSFNSSQTPESNSTDGCDATASGLYFVSLLNGEAPDVEGGQAIVAIGDAVYNDAYAITPVVDGWFGIDQGAMEVTDGIITDISDCAE